MLYREKCSRKRGSTAVTAMELRLFPRLQLYRLVNTLTTVAMKANPLYDHREGAGSSGIFQYLATFSTKCKQAVVLLYMLGCSTILEVPSLWRRRPESLSHQLVHGLEHDRFWNFWPTAHEHSGRTWRSKQSLRHVERSFMLTLQVWVVSKSLITNINNTK